MFPRLSLIISLKPILGFVTLLAAVASATAAPPKIMVLPDDQWLDENGYMEFVDNQGKTTMVQHYDEAFLNADLKNMVTCINALMQDRNFPLVDYATQKATDDDEEALEELYVGEDGEELSADAFEQALSRTKPDIVLRVGWNRNAIGGFKYNVSLRIEAVDSYSRKAVASVAPETGPTVTTIPQANAIKQASADNMDDLAAKLMAYFDDVQTNGREVRVIIRVKNGSDINLNSDLEGGDILGDVIYDWFAENTVNHQFDEEVRTRNRMVLDQVRIPLVGDNHRPVQARQFVEKLRRELKEKGVMSENTSSGLGNGRLYIGQ